MSTPAVHPAWVLVVDDDATSRMVLFRLLERAGHHATVADNGAQALELLRAEPFDLVLLDLCMPDPDGFAVLEAIRGDPRLRDIPVIVVSGLDDLGPAVRCIELGADDYLDKPVDPVLLRARVGAVVDRARLRRQQRDYLDVVGHMAQAAATVATNGPAASGGGTDHLDSMACRADSFGQLARAVQDMALRVAELRHQLQTGVTS